MKKLLNNANKKFVKTKSKYNLWQEIIKIRAEINEIKTNKTTQRI